MDQVSSAVGGIVSIDFKHTANPVIADVGDAFSGSGYQLVVVDTGSTHIELTPEYAAIPEEIKLATKVLGKQTARELSMNDLLVRLTEVRSRVGDRAALRLMHYIEENERANKQAIALNEGRFSDFLGLVQQSGKSSIQLLQNCTSPANSKEQGILLALALTERICPDAVCRIHGGGFAGTIQAYIPIGDLAHYCTVMDEVFGSNAVIPIKIGRPGVCCLTETGWNFPPERS